MELKAYIASLKEVQEWAEKGQPDAIEYLKLAADCPAPLFGVDSDDMLIHAWFRTQEQADKWLTEVQEN